MRRQQASTPPVQGHEEQPRTAIREEDDCVRHFLMSDILPCARRLFFVAATSAILSLGVPLWECASAQTRNIVKNPGFEEFDERGDLGGVGLVGLGSRRG
jgi:hypothetical protein